MLYLYQSNRLELLASILARQLEADPLPPLVAERVVVPHRGVGRWLSLQLAAQTGICADLEFELPASFIWRISGEVAGMSPGENRFDPGVLVWSILAQLPHFAGDERFQAANRYLAGGDPHKALQFASRLARLFDRYLVYRPDWIEAWEAGRSATAGDEWQAALWSRIAGERPQHWVRLGLGLKQALGRGETLADSLPQRISLFGISSLSPGYLEVIQLLSGVMDLHLYLLNPAATYWGDLVQEWERERREIAADGSELYLEVGNPLLGSLGKQGQQLFAAVGEMAPEDGAESFIKSDDTQLLGRLQNDLLESRDSRTDPRPLPLEDFSLGIHACHGPMREVEVLYDQLLYRFEQLPDLTPDQVLVMTPDLDTYAPLIEAVFGEPGDRPPIPFSLADRSPGVRSPLVERFFALFELPRSRFGIDEVVATLETPAIARRFGLDEEALETVVRWLWQAGVRWGRDAEHRSALELPAVEQNSWRAGIDRLLLGYAMSDTGDPLFEGLRPLDEVEGSEAAHLGCLIDFLDRVFALGPLIEVELEPAAWVEQLGQLIDQFFDPSPEEEEPLQGVRDGLAEWLRQTRLGGYERPCPLHQFLPHLRTLVEGATGNHRFLAGGVTVCGLTPNRILPFEVIALVGLNDGAFPRDLYPLGFDLMGGRWRFGDHSPRMEDRYLFLESLHSARRALYISYCGQDVRDNTRRPPSVVVSELIDYLAGCYTPPLGEGEGEMSVAERLVTRHPLHAFSPRYFLGEAGLHSYSARVRRAAECRDEVVESPLVGAALADPEPLEPWLDIGLEELARFLYKPIDWFCTRRLGLALEEGEEPLIPREPMSLGFFDGIELSERLVKAQLEGRDPAQVASAAAAEGFLPHGKWGRKLLDGVQSEADAFARQLAECELGTPLEPLSFELQHGEVRLSGLLTGATDLGFVRHSVHPPWGSDQLLLWLQHLALNHIAPADRRCETRWISPDATLKWGPVEEAATSLGELLTLYRAALNRPLPLLPKSAKAFVEARQKGKDEEVCLGLARKSWAGDSYHPGEFESSPWNAILLGEGYQPGEAFGQAAETIWGPLLDHSESG